MTELPDKYKPLKNIDVEIKDPGIPLYGIFVVVISLLIYITLLVSLIL